MMSSLPDIDEEANRLPENTLHQTERRRSDGILIDSKSHNNTNSRLSTVSRLWDIEQKGYLTRSQRRARAADADGKGYLTAEEAQSLGTEITLLQDQYKRIQHSLKRVLFLLVILCGGSIAATYYAITGNVETTMIDENGTLLAADGGTQVSVKSTGLKIFTYTMPSVSSQEKVCISADDLALAWSENENGGLATFVIQSLNGDQVLRLGASDARMTEEKVSFGELELFPDPECTTHAGGVAEESTGTEQESSTSTVVGKSITTPDDSNRRLRENVQALREGRDIHRQLRMVAFSFSDGDLC